jgi:hypothetical protein
MTKDKGNAADGRFSTAFSEKRSQPLLKRNDYFTQ